MPRLYRSCTCSTLHSGSMLYAHCKLLNKNSSIAQFACSILVENPYTVATVKIRSFVIYKDESGRGTRGLVLTGGLYGHFLLEGFFDAFVMGFHIEFVMCEGEGREGEKHCKGQENCEEFGNDSFRLRLLSNVNVLITVGAAAIGLRLSLRGIAAI